MVSKKVAVVLDFDGTLTDTRQVSSHNSLLAESIKGIKAQTTYKSLFLQAFLKATGYSRKALEQMVEQEEQATKDDLTSGFRLNGFDVTAANSDQYILTQAVFQRIGKINEIPNIDKIGYECHREAYARQTKNPFRDNAKALLEYLQTSDFYVPIIVSNSATEGIVERLKEIGMNEIPVQGDARKLVIDPSWKDTPETLMPSPYPRDILLRRPHYAGILFNIADKQGKSSKPIVIGDNFELDLALPVHYKMNAVKVNNGMPDIHFERTYFRDKVLFAKNLSEVINYLKERK